MAPLPFSGFDDFTTFHECRGAGNGTAAAAAAGGGAPSGAAAAFTRMRRTGLPSLASQARAISGTS
eukprot:4428813-Lingulodinium_polyedra.AAC.1